MKLRQVFTVMVGTFPPPLHGMSAVNAAVRQEMRQRAGREPLVLDTAPATLGRSFLARSVRIPKVAAGIAALLRTPDLRGVAFYLSVSGGCGQIFDCLFIAAARLRGMRLFLHHHSYAYLDMPSRLSRVLTAVAGRAAVHIAQSRGMADRLATIYRLANTVPVSNAVLLLDARQLEPEPRSTLRTLGFISNIAAEKGVFDFLDLLEAANDAGLQLRGKLAGPFQDAETERRVRTRLRSIPLAQYVGPKFGDAKEHFFSEIDALVFPTRYGNETEGIVNHEAMSRGIPVIAYGRGCIAEIIGEDSGKVVGTCEAFVPVALSQITTWVTDSKSFERASKAAAKRFAETFDKHNQRWQELLAEVAGCGRATHSD